jgi:hypothetical protein
LYLAPLAISGDTTVMSEDKTKVLGNEEPTEELASPQKFDTTPVLPDILAEMRQGFEKVETGLNALSVEGAQNFIALQHELRRINKRLDVMSADMQQLRTDQKITDDRLDEIERKAS